jgi:hypothetical protein
LSSDRFDPKTIEQAVRPSGRSADVAVAVEHQEAIVSLHGAPQPRRGPAGQPAPKEKTSGGCASSSSSQIGLGPPPARRRNFRRAQNLRSLRGRTWAIGVGDCCSSAGDSFSFALLSTAVVPPSHFGLAIPDSRAKIPWVQHHQLRIRRRLYSSNRGSGRI